MFVLTFLAAVAVAGVVVVVRRSRSASRGNRNTYELGRVVLEAFGEDWAARLGRPLTALRPAALAGSDPELRRALDDLVGPVEVDFDGSGRPGTSVPVTVSVAYSDDRTQSRAEMMLPWDLVPAAVRAELIRGRTKVSQTWRAAPEHPPTAERTVRGNRQ